MRLISMRILSYMGLYMRRKSYAKVTLSLFAYREGNTLKFKNVIVPIDLFDMIYLEKSETMAISTNKSFLPNDKRNTVYLALEIMKQRYNISDNFKVKIIKNIPPQSGLGGGSANAATIINMIDDLYDLSMTLDDKMDIAKLIDEDTPYCIENTPSLVEGIGEVITPIALNTPLYYLLVKPRFGISTKRFMRKFKGDYLVNAGHIDKMIEACEKGDFNGIIMNRYNSFEKEVSKNFEPFEAVVMHLESMGLEGVGMTGSGSCIFGVSENRDKVMKLYEKLAFKYPFVKYGIINPDKI